MGAFKKWNGDLENGRKNEDLVKEMKKKKTSLTCYNSKTKKNWPKMDPNDEMEKWINKNNQNKTKWRKSQNNEQLANKAE